MPNNETVQKSFEELAKGLVPQYHFNRAHWCKMEDVLELVAKLSIAHMQEVTAAVIKATAPYSAERDMRDDRIMEAKDIPEVGKIYHVFDDGKITWSRHFLVKCKAVIPLKQLATDPQYAKVYEAWKNRGCDWLYADTTDYVVVCEDIEDSVSEGILRGDTWDSLLFYTRTKHWEWFGFGTLLDDGVLDVTRKVWMEFLENVRGGEMYEYTPDTIAEIEAADKY